jgi:hypothetical protein
MMSPDRFSDREVAEWIEAQPRDLTHSELAAGCAERFGPERVWDADTICDYWLGKHPVPPRTWIDRDPGVTAFLRDRIGRQTLDAIVAQCREQFPAKRVPSRSALHRWISRERMRRRAQWAAGGHGR